MALSECATHTVHHGRVLDAGGREVDEVLATVMRAPNTYTTEHIIEFGCHGGPVPARRVLAACIEAGARQARRGEFTERAYLSGRIDLVQAEAVADIVSAETPLGLEMALGQLGGGLSDDIAELRATLLSMRAEVEAAIDFPEDVDAAAAISTAATLGQRGREHIGRLLENHEVGAAIRDGVSVALVGKPNVGKSSLMNALLNRDRSIVTTIAGTTRDAIEECLHLDGVPMRLVDTAGWRDTSDEAERAGVERARAAAKGAALSVLVVDGSAAAGRGGRRGRCFAGPADDCRRRQQERPGPRCCRRRVRSAVRRAPARPGTPGQRAVSRASPSPILAHPRSCGRPHSRATGWTN